MIFRIGIKFMKSSTDADMGNKLAGKEGQTARLFISGGVIAKQEGQASMVGDLDIVGI